jgi:hypothetical protein
MKGFSLAFSIHASTFLWRMSQFHLTFISLCITITTFWELHVIFLFFEPCIFNDEERINQQNAQINFFLY